MKKNRLIGMLLFVLLLAACGQNRNKTITPPDPSAASVTEATPTPTDSAAPDVQATPVPTDSSAPLSVTEAAPASTDSAAPDAQATSVPEISTPTDTETTPVPTDAPSLDLIVQEMDAGHRAIYQQTVAEHENEDALFSLIYLNGDDIPELLIYDQESDYPDYWLSYYSIYTIRDDHLFCMVDHWYRNSLDDLSYYERRGILQSSDRWRGGGMEGGFGWYYYQVSDDQTITDDTRPTLYYEYNAVYDENGYTGEGITDCYYMGQALDEEAFEELCNSLGFSSYAYGNDAIYWYENPCLDKEGMLTVLEP